MADLQTRGTIAIGCCCSSDSCCSIRRTLQLLANLRYKILPHQMAGRFFIGGEHESEQFFDIFRHHPFVVRASARGRRWSAARSSGIELRRKFGAQHFRLVSATTKSSHTRKAESGQNLRKFTAGN